MPDGSRFNQAFRFANIAALEVRGNRCQRKKEYARHEAGHVAFYLRVVTGIT
jgi:CxxC motif-containing protein